MSDYQSRGEILKKMNNEELIHANKPDISMEYLGEINAEIALRIKDGRLEHPKTECFCCGDKLDLELRGDDSDPHIVLPLYGGLRFRSTGNYGSTVYDPMGENRQFLEIVVCDACVVKKKEKVRRVHHIHTSTTAKMEQFDPDKC